MTLKQFFETLIYNKVNDFPDEGLILELNDEVYVLRECMTTNDGYKGDYINGFTGEVYDSPETFVTVLHESECDDMFPLAQFFYDSPRHNWSSKELEQEVKTK